MRPRNFFGLQTDKIRAGQAELIPVNWTFRKVGQTYPRNWNGLPFNCILCVPVPFVGGGNNNASRELLAAIIGCELLPRRREEGVNIWFLNCVAWMALLHKLAESQSFPFARQTYPVTSVIGVPRAVKPFRTATRTWNSAT